MEKIEIDWSRELSVVRIHVERVIGVLKQKYTIFQTKMPITLVSDTDDKCATIDKFFTVYSALVNLCPLVLPQD